MKTKAFSTLFLVTAILGVSTLASAADLQVEYLEGTLEVKNNLDTWMPIRVGDAIEDDDMLRLSGRGFVEFSINNNRVTLTQDGVYEASQFLGERNITKKNYFSVLGSKFSSLLNRKSSGMTIAAVRGAEGRNDAISWESEDTNFLRSGIASYERADFVNARDMFMEGMIWEAGATQRECTFRYAQTLLALGDPRAGRRTLSGLQPLPTDPFYGEYVVTMGTLYIESMEYDQAENIFATYLKNVPQGDAAQEAWYLSGVSQHIQGMTEKSHKSLQNAVRLGASTEIGRAATTLLN